MPDIFFDTNVGYTLKLIDFFVNKCNTLVVYGTSELWNQCEGAVQVSDPVNFEKTPYITSKFVLSGLIKEKNYNNVIVLHPFNFNSIYRKGDFLFGKIFDSIINKKHIEIGDTYFYRDLIHPKYVVQRSILAENDEIVGSGRLIFVNDFIRELYNENDLCYADLVTENFDHNLSIKRKIFYAKHQYQQYSNLLKDTLNDINKLKNKIS
jgi:nucleoside-diphosphate-sugar epimerase